mmetsp:Transcript_43690/g.87805  ORF Transcript_43690/g.87805 Transcript_43690/m.87805 type:complete len:254 (-) Transcript_43690:204-965(-)
MGHRPEDHRLQTSVWGDSARRDQRLRHLGARRQRPHHRAAARLLPARSARARGRDSVQEGKPQAKGSVRGPLTFFRNSCRVNTLFLRAPLVCFDEWYGEEHTNMRDVIAAAMEDPSFMLRPMRVLAGKVSGRKGTPTLRRGRCSVSFIVLLAQRRVRVRRRLPGRRGRGGAGRENSHRHRHCPDYFHHHHHQQQQQQQQEEQQSQSQHHQQKRKSSATTRWRWITAGRTTSASWWCAGRDQQGREEVLGLGST